MVGILYVSIQCEDYPKGNLFENIKWRIRKNEIRGTM